jgi:hypothetical protein
VALGDALTLPAGRMKERDEIGWENGAGELVNDLTPQNTGQCPTTVLQTNLQVQNHAGPALASEALCECRLCRRGSSHLRSYRAYSTTDSDHDLPIFPNLAKTMAIDGPNQLWVSDITYVAIAVGFVYVAVVLDAWSRRVVGYAIGSIH